MDLEISTDASRVTTAQIAAIYDTLGWGTAEFYLNRPSFMERSFGPGTFGFFAFDRESGRLAGFLRALSDDYSVAWISELCVLPEYQRTGIGTALLETASERFSDIPLYADAFSHNFEFFTKRGLRQRPVLVPCTRGPVKRASA